ncbi:glycoside hydrolase family 9 protein [Opitutus sp. ER46]|uniref:glycoside hydrolase family 9 protein n=1 Tax=Opitutus sp. ER46 TaxID=2161864 RepID=UPI0018EE9288|nr:glycoside hydrolase family 9 protein [Opitutus sp. ER46]
MPPPLRFVSRLVALTLLLALPRSVGAAPIDEASPRLPAPGDATLRLLSPTLLELVVISAPGPDDPPLPLEATFRAADFKVSVAGQPVTVTGLSFKRRVLYAPIKRRDLRVATHLIAQLSAPVSDNQEVRLSHANSPLWPASKVFHTRSEPRRYSPALHVNQEGYERGQPKVAFVGYYLGTGGELPIPAEAGFDLLDARTGERVHHGELRRRREQGFAVVPQPYQAVYEADFSAFDRAGTYQLAVAGLGASLPFRIGDGELLGVARAYALGLYHQRCGCDEGPPFTRFAHAACHTAPADVPLPVDAFAKTWGIIADLYKDAGQPERPEQQIHRASDLLYPFVRQGKVDVSGGHHDAGDYSKYTINSATLIHALVFAVDSFPGVAALDNLGIPESGDGISDLLQEAKWEADYLAKLQDDDGGFYFLVYPRDRRYENDVPPDRGDPQVVWPKTTAATAAAVAALAQCAGSPAFKRHYPDVAQRYLAQATRGWAFLERALSQHGKADAYQRLTHYGDSFQHDDELAWAAAELFVATGNRAYERRLFEWFPNPGDPATRQYGWRRASFAYGNALRSYAFAPRNGRLARNQVDANYLARCELELRRAGDDVLRASQQSAYGVSFPEASKRIGRAGWFFASDEAFDLTVAYQLQARPAYLAGVLANLNYELGANPVNRVFVTGLGIRRQHEIVHQFAQTDDRALPPSGIPLGAVQSEYHYSGLYRAQLADESWPRDSGAGPIYPLYDRWSDAYNLSTEFVVTNQARSLASLAFWAAQTPARTQAWRPTPARIIGAAGTVAVGAPLTFRLEAGALDLGAARIVWEARDQQPAFGPTFTFAPTETGAQWVEAEAALPDGRRVVARHEFRATAPVVYWINGALPRGARPSAQGGDNWGWIKPASKPPELAAAHSTTPQHESALAPAIHEHGFDEAETRLEVDPGDVLFAWMFIDPKHPPKTIMLEWNDGSFEHRAYWGPNLIPWGKANTPGQWPMGPVPPAGRWVRLDVPAKAVALEGRTLKGMTFRLHGGRVRWDAAGKRTPPAPPDAKR